MVRPMNLMTISLSLHFVHCKMSLVLKNNAVWNTVTVDKESFKSTDGNFNKYSV